MTEPADIRIAEAKLLQRQGRFTAAAAAAERVPAGDPLHAAAQLLVFRILLEQGHIGRAARHAGELLRSPVDGDDGVRLRLWTGFFACAGLLPGVAADLEALEREVAAVIAEPGAPPSLRALGLDLRARSVAIRWIPAGGFPPHLRAPLADAFEAAAHAYDEAGEPDEGDGARRHAADLLRHPAGGDPARAAALLETAVVRAVAAADLLREGEARLARAEAALEAFLARGTEGADAAAELAAFEHAARCLEAGGHAHPGALVQRGLSRLLLRYGADEGAVLAAEAARGFEAAGAATAARDLWVELVRWHKQHGHPGPEGEAMEAAQRCAAAIGAPVVSRAEELAGADGALRVGNVAEAGRVLARGVDHAEYPAQRAANGIIRSNALAAVGHRAQAAALLREVIAALPPEHPTPILFQAWALLSNHLQASDPAAAVQAATRAVEVARATGERVDEGHALGQRGWLRAWEAWQRGERGVPAAAHADFDAAAAVLRDVFTLEGRLELADLHQSRALALFYAGALEEALDELARTEAIARAYGIGPSVAFVTAQRGLMLMQAARRAGPEVYDAARERFTEALEWLDRSGLRAMRWSVLHHRASCDSEAAARWAQAEGGAARDRRARALADLREAAAEIDRLRGMADAEPAALSQPVRMAFVVDKAKVYALGLDLALALGDPAEALRWLERGKGRALLDALAESAPPADGGAGRAGRAALLRSADPPAWPELRGLLRREEREAGGRRVVVAQWAVAPGRTLLFGMRGDWAEPRVERVEVDGEALDGFARLHFRTPGGVRMLMADHGARGEQYWARFAPLVAPLAAWTEPDDVVCLVPHGPLHDLPLHVLPVDGVPLGLRNPVFHAPAAALLRHTLGRGRRPPGGGAAVFGDPAGDLPGARAEAAAVGAALGVTPLLGGQVTREAVLAALRTAGLLHFAGHADASAADGFEAGLLLAGGDVLRARELLSLRTRARLVVLGGCETGVSEHRPGDELAGLARALLVAGAGALLVSQWRVADASTGALLREVHRRAGGGAPLAEALRGAMAAVRAVDGWEHFHHWGGFVMVGQWR